MIRPIMHGFDKKFADFTYVGFMYRFVSLVVSIRQSEFGEACHRGFSE